MEELKAPVRQPRKPELLPKESVFSNNIPPHKSSDASKWKTDDRTLSPKLFTKKMGHPRKSKMHDKNSVLPEKNTRKKQDGLISLRDVKTTKQDKSVNQNNNVKHQKNLNSIQEDKVMTQYQLKQKFNTSNTVTQNGTGWAQENIVPENKAPTIEPNIQDNINNSDITICLYDKQVYEDPAASFLILDPSSQYSSPAQSPPSWRKKSPKIPVIYSEPSLIKNTVFSPQNTTKWNSFKDMPQNKRYNEKNSKFESITRMSEGEGWGIPDISREIHGKGWNSLGPSTPIIGTKEPTKNESTRKEQVNLEAKIEEIKTVFEELENLKKKITTETLKQDSNQIGVQPNETAVLESEVKDTERDDYVIQYNEPVQKKGNFLYECDVEVLDHVFKKILIYDDTNIFRIIENLDKEYNSKMGNVFKARLILSITKQTAMHVYNVKKSDLP